jgi:osmotically-inducible protein OsmY
MPQDVDENDRNNGWIGPYRGIGPKGYQRPDARIVEEAAARLALHGQLDASNISLGVRDGMVTLQGTVPDRHQKRMAEDIIDSIHGVKDVDNQITIQRQ